MTSDQTGRTLVYLARHGQTPLNESDVLPQENGCFNTLELRDDRRAVLTVNELPGGTACPRGAG